MIKKVTLIFPEGIEMSVAQEIATRAEAITGFVVSQGGYKCINELNLMTESGPVEWDESHAEFIHSYKRKVPEIDGNHFSLHTGICAR